MKPICPLCVERHIQVRAEQGMVEYDAVCFGDLAVHAAEVTLIYNTHQEIKNIYAMAHLPSGLGLVNVNCLFWKQEQAENAMMEISRLKNYWSFESKSESDELIPKVMEIGARHGGFNIPGSHIVEFEYSEGLNGYDNTSISQQ